MSDYKAVVDQAVQVVQVGYSKVDTISDADLDTVGDYLESIKESTELTHEGAKVVGLLYFLHELGLIEFKEIK